MTASTNNIPALDWAQAENHCNNFLNSDLFGGDLFGDELIDMYSSVSDDDPDVINSDSKAGKIPFSFCLSSFIGFVRN
jgi:hypothetical protein